MDKEHTPSLLPSHPYVDADGIFGRVPQSILDDEEAQLITAHENSQDLQSLRRVAENAYKQYLKSRPTPSPESIKRVKNAELHDMAVHPLLGQLAGWPHPLYPDTHFRVWCVIAQFVLYRVWTGKDGVEPATNGGQYQELQVKSCMCKTIFSRHIRASSPSM